jgi:hypothetical protein
MVPDTTVEVLAISQVKLKWLQAVADAYPSYSDTAPILQSLAVQSSTGHYELRQGIIFYKNRVLLPAKSEFPQKVFETLHNTLVGGHSGLLVTYHKIKKLFRWIGLKKQIQQWCHNCPTCQQAKPERVPYPGLLQPLPVLDGAWKVVSMDFIEGLPLSDHSNCIMVVVDKLSKYSHFVPLHHPFIALMVAHKFMDHIFKLHGFPQALISDRDHIFTSALWQELFKLAGVDLRFTTAYHPQSDGQSERVNQCLETYLHCFTQACPSKWKHWLSLAEYWYNTSYHTSLKWTPFEVLYRYPPNHLGLHFSDQGTIPSLQTWLTERKLMIQLIQQQLTRAQQCQKKQADLHRTPRTFEVGDLVCLKLQPYVQSSLVKQANHKLAFKFFGPYRVLAKVGEVAYKLDLPPQSTIHPVFHVSLLKKVLGSNVQVSAALPPVPASSQQPEKILQRKEVATQKGHVTQVLI